MAVYVDLSRGDIESLLSHYDLGVLQDFQGIQKGVSNTNYLVTTDRDMYILTLFEERRTRRDDLPFIFDWASHLNANNIACPVAIPDKNGRRLQMLRGKTTVLVQFLEGKDIPRGQTTVEHCRQMGVFTAKLHQASKDFKSTRENDWPITRFQEILSTHNAEITAYNKTLNDLIAEELTFQRAHDLMELPSGTVHTDLFPDNVFLKNGQITAMIDMYFACTHAFLYDLAIVVNAWCFGDHGKLQDEQLKALLNGYTSVRPLTQDERQMFQAALRLASLRFLMSRLEEWVTYDPQTATLTPHDPAEYIQRLLFHRQHDIIAP